MIQVFLNAREPPFMRSHEADLNAEKIQKAVRSMTYDGLQAAAALGLAVWNRLGQSPAEFCRAIEESSK